MMKLSAIFIFLIVKTITDSTALNLACSEDFEERPENRLLHEGCIIRDLSIADSSALEDVIFPSESTIILYKPEIAANVSRELQNRLENTAKDLIVFGGHVPELQIWPGLEKLVLFGSQTRGVAIDQNVDQYNLRVFNAWNCSFDATPANINQLTELISFEMYGCNIESVDLGQFDGLSQLIHIGLVRQKIAEVVVTKSVSLANLTSLSLNDNNLRAVDTRLWRMPNLKRLSLTTNKLRFIIGLERFEELQMLELYNNRLNCDWIKYANESLKKERIPAEMLQPCPSTDNVEQQEFCCVGDRTDPAFQEYLLATETDAPPATVQ
ncbi:uncharacterized protein LOC129767684 [Toxorhynchites rutilus septentrionalis]|uniref:uncharacterized protein LOC129767684 n=1 Tax=Toxorhynchites rutilus septentrionalis TaxID=329112 RepID=UPI0024787A4D|nr:uncharacterized protein LOC129767684 [Toxorhynchites rutilus septentrionalis]